MSKVITGTKSLTRLEWLQKRQQGIGGSDAGAILGLNKNLEDFISSVFRQN